MLEVVDEMASYGVHKVLLSGGEPFLLPYLEELCEAASSSGMLVDINTNGTLWTRDRLEKLHAAGVHELTVSLDAATDDIFALTRPGGSLDLVRDNIVLATELGFDVDVVFVPTHLNSHQFESVARITVDAGAKSLTAAGLVRYEEAEKNWNLLALTRREVSILRKEIKALRASMPIPIRTNRLFTELPLDNCLAGSRVLGIDASGYVNPCALYIIPPSIFNDLRKKPFYEIVSSELFRQSVKLHEEMTNCNGCSFRTTCKGGCLGAKQMEHIPSDSPDPICLEPGV